MIWIKKEKTWKFILWNTLCVIIVSCILNAVIWILFHGIPLIGLPEKRKKCKSVTIISHNETEKEKLQILKQ